MDWVLWTLAALVIGGCAVLAVGRGGELGEAYEDRPDVLVPTDRPLAADDLRALRLPTAVRGYRMAEVDALLARLAAEIDRQNRHPRVDSPGGASSSDIGDVTDVGRRGRGDDSAG
jgi:DivIVA domain-containing protein